MNSNPSSQEQINSKVIELFKQKKTLNAIKSQVEQTYNCTVEYNTLARIIRLHLGTYHNLFARK